MAWLRGKASVGWISSVSVQSLQLRNMPAGPKTPYEPAGTLCGPGSARVATAMATASVWMPPMAGLGSAQRTRTTLATTGAPVALAT